MDPIYIEGKLFDKVVTKENPLIKGEYENCTFINCDLENSILSDIRFVECEFGGCNLSLAILTNTALMNVKFRDCKMLGLQFERCAELGFSISFDHCNLSQSSFYRMKLKKTIFKESQLHQVDFTDGDLSNSVFDQCDLEGAHFENTILEKVDFRTSFNYSIDPAINRIRKARFSLFGISGLLDKYDIDIDLACNRIPFCRSDHFESSPLIFQRRFEVHRHSLRCLFLQGTRPTM